jgi:hypothetical protein
MSVQSQQFRGRLPDDPQVRITQLEKQVQDLQRVVDRLSLLCQNLFDNDREVVFGFNQVEGILRASGIKATENFPLPHVIERSYDQLVSSWRSTAALVRVM